MIAVTTFAGKRAAVFGLGGSGLVTAHALAQGGAEIVCFDDDRTKVEAAWDAGLPTGDLRVADFSAFDALVLSPGVPLTHPEPHWAVKRAREAGIEIIGDIELFDRERRARLPALRLVAITGTNGKSTTTALVGHLLREMGADAQVGGNIGRPALDLDAFDGVAVLEVSSFQIDLSPTLSPDVGVLLNISSDHLDRHGTFQNYRAIKERLPDASRVAVLGHDCQWTNWYARALRRRMQGFERPLNVGETRVASRWQLPVSTPGVQRLIGFAADRWTPSEEFPRRGGDESTGGVLWGVDYDGAVVIRSRVERQRFAAPPHLRDVHAGWDILVERDGEDTGPIAEFTEVPALRGLHNVQNAAAALAVVLALGLDPKDAVPHLATFPGLPHRMEEVGRDGDVLYINDSKATNLDSAVTALKAFRGVHWIAGGKPKPGGLTELKPERFDIRRAYLIGEAAEAFAGQLSGRVDATLCGTLEAAVEAAARDAEAAGGGVVLLSPACASFDQFKSFGERGDVFRALVRARLVAKGEGRW